MRPPSLLDWLVEQERKKSPSIFLMEWISIFAIACVFWTWLFFRFHTSSASVLASVAVSALYACAFVYLRLFRETGCRKCGSRLPFSRQEVGRRYLHDGERCIEIEHGGVEWEEHYIDIYARVYRVEMVKYRCLRCHAVWEQIEQSPASEYELVRTLDLKK